MNTLSASPAERGAAAPATLRVLIWDLPVRVFHWLTALSFAGAYFTAESERWRLVHVTLGYTVGALVVFRLVWGLVGTRPARFASFVRGPVAVWQYLDSMLRGKPQHHSGHNPAGAAAILLMLALAAVTTVAGWAVYNDVGGEWLGALHEVAANLMLGVVGVHIAAVVYSSWAHGENLARAMVTGRKLAPPQDAIRHAWRSVAALMLVAVLGFWWLQWQSAPPAGGLDGRPAASASDHDDDD